MSPQAQRIAIAEACGWINQGKRKGVPALNHRWAKPDGRIYSGELPDYLNDLNAMHEAEQILTGSQQMQYADLLSRTTTEGHVDFCDVLYASIHATAAQRAEAFLRTIGQWKEERTP